VPDLTRDPIVNVVHQGIKHDIRLLLKHGGVRGALLLTFCAVDAMAYLGMEDAKEDVTRQDFIAWVDRYVRFQCAEMITGLELYAARCAALHSYATEASLTREGRCRQIGWRTGARPEIIFDPKHADLVVVSIPALAEACLKGIDQFLVDTYSGPERAQRADRRFRKMMYALPGPGN
jgi:hypothetical protein